MTPKQEAAARQALHRLQAHTDTADLDAIAALNEALAEQQAAEPATEADMAVYKAIADNYHASLPQAVEPVADIAALIVQSCCETDPADPANPNTICIGVSDLDVIIKSTMENYRQAAEPVATDDRCPKCGYLTCHTEHIGCLRDAVSAINTFERRNFAIVDVDTHPAPTQQAAEPVAWQPIETAPKDGRKVILFYLNRNTKARTVMARWLTDEEAAEADGDGVGLESGWYECIDNWDDYTEVAIHEGEPSHWMPLPKAPAAHGITGSQT